MRFLVHDSLDLSSFNRYRTGYLIFIPFGQTGSFRIGDVIESESGRWEIVGAEHRRPAKPFITRQDNTFGMTIRPLLPIYTRPKPGWFELLGKPKVE